MRLPHAAASFPVLLALIVGALGLSACASGPWPSLNAPLPDPASRALPADETRVHQRVQPSAPDPSSRTRPATDPRQALEGIRATLATERRAYLDARNAWQDSRDAESRNDRFFAAHLALTRLSRTLSRLDGLRDPATGKATDSVPTPVAEKAQQLHRTTKRFIMAERARLGSAFPG